MKTTEAREIIKNHNDYTGHEITLAISHLQFKGASVYEPRGLSDTGISKSVLGEIYLAHRDLDRYMNDAIAQYVC